MIIKGIATLFHVKQSHFPWFSQADARNGVYCNRNSRVHSAYMYMWRLRQHEFKCTHLEFLSTWFPCSMSSIHICKLLGFASRKLLLIKVNLEISKQTKRYYNEIRNKSCVICDSSFLLDRKTRQITSTAGRLFKNKYGYRLCFIMCLVFRLM